MLPPDLLDGFQLQLEDRYIGDIAGSPSNVLILEKFPEDIGDGGGFYPAGYLAFVDFAV
ncbi:hypothetical protein ES708_28460 [subsurface metagenome]